MTKQEFFVNLKEELEIDVALVGVINLKNLDEWDSMTAMVLIGYVSNEFGVTLTAEDLEVITTIDSLIEKIGVDKFD